MFRGLTRVSILSTLLCATSASAAINWYVSDATRNAVGGRTVQVIVAQPEIAWSTYDLSGATAGGGVLGYLIGAGMTSADGKKAEAAIAPLRAAMTGYDFDTLAREVNAQGLAGVEWFHPEHVQFGKDASTAAKMSVLDSAPTEQVALMEYWYGMLPNFSGVRVSLAMNLTSRTVPPKKKPESRLSTNNLGYIGDVTVLVVLPEPSKLPEENVARWSANGAALTREALSIASREMRQLIPRALNLTAAEGKALKANTDHARNVARNYRVKPQIGITDHVLVYGDYHIGTVPVLESWLSVWTLPQ